MKIIALNHCQFVVFDFIRLLLKNIALETLLNLVSYLIGTFLCIFFESAFECARFS